jgi:glyoxylase-like metal-dependent hydrolase (beta-lactamase superfamily II)
MTDDDPEDGETPSITPAELQALLAAGEPVSILDVRDRDETETWRIEGPTVSFAQVPMMQFVGAEAKGSVGELAADAGLAGPIVAVCGRGEASDHVAGLLNEAGIEARNLAGGMDAWARLYTAAEIDGGAGGDAADDAGNDVDAGRGDGATVIQYHRPSSGCLAYMVVSEGEATVIDPLRAFTGRYVADAADRGASIVAAIDTHVHADHVSGVRDLAAETGARRILPAGANERGLAFDAETIEDGDRIEVGDASIEAVAAPGHTTEMTALRLGDVLFSGDGLFLRSVARPDLERGDDGARDLAGTLYETLQDLRALPGETIVAPGHVEPAAAPGADGSYTATLGGIRDRLHLLSLDRAAFVDRILDDLPPRPANYGQIIKANLGRETVDDEEAFELELGPNNCAVSA